MLTPWLCKYLICFTLVLSLGVNSEKFKGFSQRSYRVQCIQTCPSLADMLHQTQQGKCFKSETLSLLQKIACKFRAQTQSRECKCDQESNF